MVNDCNCAEQGAKLVARGGQHSGSSLTTSFCLEGEKFSPVEEDGAGVRYCLPGEEFTSS
jgi:hypothetical protein